MADNPGAVRPTRPAKGILKSSSSFDKTEPPHHKTKETKWDEMNIIQTLHPADKDYGHMKIEEPKTPYSYRLPEEEDAVDLAASAAADGSGGGGIDADLLAKKIAQSSNELPKSMREPEDNDDESEDENETEEERAKRKMFEQKRKQHYNEYAAVKLARKLMENDDDDESDGENVADKSPPPAGSSSPPPAK